MLPTMMILLWLIRKASPLSLWLARARSGTILGNCEELMWRMGSKDAGNGLWAALAFVPSATSQTNIGTFQWPALFCKILSCPYWYVSSRKMPALIPLLLLILLLWVFLPSVRLWLWVRQAEQWAPCLPLLVWWQLLPLRRVLMFLIQMMNLRGQVWIWELIMIHLNQPTMPSMFSFLATMHAYSLRRRSLPYFPPFICWFNQCPSPVLASLWWVMSWSQICVPLTTWSPTSLPSFPTRASHICTFVWGTTPTSLSWVMGRPFFHRFETHPHLKCS